MALTNAVQKNKYKVLDATDKTASKPVEKTTTTTTTTTTNPVQTPVVQTPVVQTATPASMNVGNFAGVNKDYNGPTSINQDFSSVNKGYTGATSINQDFNVNKDYSGPTSSNVDFTSIANGYKPTDYTSATAQFVASEEYQNAIAQAKAQLEKLSSGQTSWSDKLSNAINAATADREAFSYDPNTDTLFQNYLSGAMRNGQTAMQNTIGQAAGLTGGYGSTYATSAANQAYNQYVQDAYGNLPDYYNLAMQAYQLESDRLKNNVDIYRAADDTEYGRNLNAYNAYANMAQQQYDNEYNNYWQKQNFDESSRQWAAGMNQSDKQYATDLAMQAALNDYRQNESNMNMSYELWKAQNANSQWAAEQAYNQAANNRDFDYELWRANQNDAQWTADRNYAQSADNRDFEYGLWRANQGDSQWAAGMDYTKSTNDRDYNYQVARDAVSDAQWNANYNYKVARDAKEDAQWAAEQEAKAKSNSSTASGSPAEADNGYVIGNNQKALQAIYEAYNESESAGDAIYNSYATQMTDADMELIESYLAEHNLGPYKFKVDEVKLFRDRYGFK